MVDVVDKEKDANSMLVSILSVGRISRNREAVSGVSEGMLLGFRARISLLLFVSSSRVCVMVMELL